MEINPHEGFYSAKARLSMVIDVEPEEQIWVWRGRVHTLGTFSEVVDGRFGGWAGVVVNVGRGPWKEVETQLSKKAALELANDLHAMVGLRH